HVDPARAGQMAGLADTDLVPGRQALDIGREKVLAADRHPHPEDRLHQQRVRARGTRPVDVRELDDEVVYPLLQHDASVASIPSSAAYGTTSFDFCMSHAPVGQRSAHSPQCTHRFSSLIITRAVCFSAADT